MLFINTRPLERAEALTSALLDLGIEVIDLPLLKLETRPLSVDLIELYKQLVDVSVLVVVSPTAAKIGLKYLRECHIQLDTLAKIKWIAVGEKTASTLDKYHIKSNIPEVETSEGMLQLPLLKTLDKGEKIAFWRGEGGRQFMMEYFRQQGMDVLNFILYERYLPQPTINIFEQFTLKLTQEQHYIILISSEASWLNWLSLTKSDDVLLNKGQYLVLGDRLFCLLDNYKKRHDLHFKVQTLTNLKPESILLYINDIQGKL